MCTVMRKIFIAWVLFLTVLFATAALARSPEGSGGSNGGNDIELIFNSGLSRLPGIVEKVSPAVVVNSPRYMQSRALQFYHDRYADIQAELKSVVLTFVTYDLFDVNGKLVSLKTDWVPGAPIVVSKSRNAISTSSDAAAAILHEISRHVGWREDSSVENVGAAVLAIYERMNKEEWERSRPPMFTPSMARLAGEYLSPYLEKLNKAIFRQMELAGQAGNGTTSGDERIRLNLQLQMEKSFFDSSLKEARMLSFIPFLGDFNGSRIGNDLSPGASVLNVELPSLELGHLGMPYRIGLSIRSDLPEDFEIQPGDFEVNGIRIGQFDKDTTSSTGGGYSARTIGAAIYSIFRETGVEPIPEKNFLMIPLRNDSFAVPRRISFLLNNVQIDSGAAPINSIDALAALINRYKNVTRVEATSMSPAPILILIQPFFNTVIRLEDASFADIQLEPFPLHKNVIVVAPLTLQSFDRFYIGSGNRQLKDIFEMPQESAALFGESCDSIAIDTEDGARKALWVLSHALDTVVKAQVVIRNMVTVPGGHGKRAKVRDVTNDPQDFWMSIYDDRLVVDAIKPELEKIMRLYGRLKELSEQAAIPSLTPILREHLNEAMKDVRGEWIGITERVRSFGVQTLKGALNGAHILQQLPQAGSIKNGSWIALEVRFPNLDPNVIGSLSEPYYKAIAQMDISTLQGAVEARQILMAIRGELRRAEVELQNISDFYGGW